VARAGGRAGRRREPLARGRRPGVCLRGRPAEDGGHQAASVRRMWSGGLPGQRAGSGSADDLLGALSTTVSRRQDSGAAIVSDDARRPLTEAERTRIHAARIGGGACGVCGKELDTGEPIWVQPLPFRNERGGATTWRVPVGAECVSATFRVATVGIEPARCRSCGRGVYFQADRRPRRLALCSRACSRRYHAERAKGR
jgi:hypothetical protein